MTTKEMLKQLRIKQSGMSSGADRSSYLTTGKDLSAPRERMNRLRMKIADDVNQLTYERSGILEQAYAYIDAHCHIAPPTMKKALQGNSRITRKMLYKYTVGMRMSLEQAQEYFELQGRHLSNDSDEEEMIAFNALRDGDSADSLIEEFLHLLGKRL